MTTETDDLVEHVLMLGPPPKHVSYIRKDMYDRVVQEREMLGRMQLQACDLAVKRAERIAVLEKALQRVVTHALDDHDGLTYQELSDMAAAALSTAEGKP